MKVREEKKEEDDEGGLGRDSLQIVALDGGKPHL